MVPKGSITAEHVLDVLEGYDVVCRVRQPYQTLSMSHITLTKQWDSIYILEYLTLDHYTTDEVHGSSSWFQETVYQLSMSGL